VLYASSSVGLGHVTRDCYLAKYLKWADVDWLTAGQALKYIEYKNFKALPVSSELKSIGKLFESLFVDGWLRVTLKDLRKIYNSIKENAIKITESVDFERYDLIIADEFWEFLFMDDLTAKSVFITDFMRFKPVKKSLFQRILLPVVNKKLMRSFMKFDLRIYVGLNKEYHKNFEYYGQIYTHDDFGEIEEEDYILVNIGGTEIGRPILEKITTILDKARMDYRIIGGATHFNPNPIRDLTRAKLIITLGGYGSLLELSRFKKRGIIIPLGNHFEQEDNASAFRNREGYRVLSLEKISREILLRYISEVLSEEPRPPKFRDGSKEIAERMRKLLDL